jgi:regulator of nucleoside diphosphate kinase
MRDIMPNTSPAHPAVRMTPSDHERLSVLSATAATLGGSILAREVERAQVVDGDAPELPFVRLHSRIEYVDLTSGRTRIVEVVPPDEADIDQRRISVLSPVGAALIGLKAGDSYAWTGEDGRPHVLVVVALENRHAAA